MKKIMVFIFVIIFIANIFGEQVNSYYFDEIGIIPKGNKEGELGWRSGGDVSGPNTFIISKDNLIYIPDFWNDRINIYDLELNFIRTITEENKIIHFTSHMRVDDYGNIIAYLDYKGLKKIDGNGTEIFFIPIENLPERVKNYIPIGKNLFFRDINNEVGYIDENGVVMDNNAALMKLGEINKQYEINSTLDYSSFSVSLPQDEKEEFRNVRNSLNIIIDGFRVYTDSANHFEYYNRIKDIRNYIEENSSRSLNNNVEVDFDNYYTGVVAYDNDDNAYWIGNEKWVPGDDVRNSLIIIFSKYGELLDAFYYSQTIGHATGGGVKYNTDLYPASGSIVAVAPNGDIYFMRGEDDGHHFWKVTRNW